ncbi:MAG: DUF2461 domain-containing protein [Actinomycetota bacterium]
MTFRGFPDEVLSFYEQLEANNTKSFWEEHKHVYRDVVRASVEALTDELSDYGSFHLFRPHNDLRFSKNRPPYKIHQGAYTEGEGGRGFYFQISAEGLMCGTGYYAMAKDQLQRFREAVDDETTGPAIQAIVDRVDTRKFSVSAIDALKTAPRGYPKDHPRIELLRRKGLLLSREFGTPKWLHTKAAKTRIREAWTAGDEMNAWLDANVGPSELAPDDRPF